MCLIAWDWQCESTPSLLLAANRDEFYSRPTQALQWWESLPILAGRDLSAGGTWLGVSRSGRMAALTNYRDPTNFREDALSRGHLVSNFLRGTESASGYLEAVLQAVDRYNPFNLLVYDGMQLLGLESRHAQVLRLQPGIGAVSNADFHTPWPKLQALRSGLAHSLDLPSDAQETALWALLGNAQPAKDEDLPNTGIDRQRESALSSAFIRMPGYGTRASTLLRMRPGAIWMAEQRYDAQGLIGRSEFTV